METTAFKIVQTCLELLAAGWPVLVVLVIAVLLLIGAWTRKPFHVRDHYDMANGNPEQTQRIARKPIDHIGYQPHREND